MRRGNNGEGSTAAGDSLVDLVGLGIADEGFGVIDPGLARAFERGNAAKDAVADHPVNEPHELASHQVKPGARGRDEVLMPAGPAWKRQPAGNLRRFVSGEIIQDHVDVGFPGDMHVDELEVHQDFVGRLAFADALEHFTSGDVQRYEQVGSAVTLLLVPRQGPNPPAFGRQARLSAIQGLALGSLAERENHCPLGLVKVQPHDVNQVVLEGKIARDLKARHLPRFQLMIPPDLRHLVLADAETASQPSGPPLLRVVIGQLVLRDPDHLRSRPVRHRRLTAPSLGDAFRPRHPLLLQATPPRPNRGIGRTTAADYLVGRRPISRQQQRLGLHNLATKQRPGPDRIANAVCRSKPKVQPSQELSSIKRLEFFRRQAAQSMNECGALHASHRDLTKLTSKTETHINALEQGH